MGKDGRFFLVSGLGGLIISAIVQPSLVRGSQWGYTWVLCWRYAEHWHNLSLYRIRITLSLASRDTTKWPGMFSARGWIRHIVFKPLALLVDENQYMHQLHPITFLPILLQNLDWRSLSWMTKIWSGWYPGICVLFRAHLRSPRMLISKEGSTSPNLLFDWRNSAPVDR